MWITKARPGGKVLPKSTSCIDRVIDYLEYFAVFSGLLYLILISKGLKAGWVFGILCAIIYTYLTCINRLYFQSFLQFSYVFLGLWGFMNWGKENFFQINTLSLKTNLGLLVIGICLTLGFSYILSFTNQKMALLDSAVSVFSIIATVLTVLKYIDNWIYWWFINLLAIYLYYMQNMEFTTVLYASYLVISIYGFIEWRAKLKAVYD